MMLNSFMQKLMAASVVLLMSMTAFATPITIGQYSYSGTGNTFYGDGLEWLRWDQVGEVSIADAVASNPGYRVATAEEARKLFTAVFGSLFAWNGTDQLIHTGGWSASTQASALNFINLVGTTHTRALSPQWQGVHAYARYQGSNSVLSVSRIHPCSPTCTPNQNNLGWAVINPNWNFPANRPTPTVALVKKQVDEPTSIVLLGLGLLGCLVRRRITRAK